MKVLLAQPRGFCAGVTRAIAIVERALAIYGAPIYVRHEIVHNRTVVENLRARGAIFVDRLADVPEGATVVFSAHGVPLAVAREAEERGLRVFDATCPLVTKVHKEVGRMRREGRTILMIGHAGHPEVEGTMGQVSDGIRLIERPSDVAALPFTDDDTLAYVTQTTISADDSREVIEALKSRYPNIHAPKRQDICYATQNRQEAVKKLAQAGVEAVLVIGSATSSNSNRLREVAEREGVRAWLVDSAGHVDPAWLEGVASIGITAGASAPESLVQGVVEWLRAHAGADEVRTLEGEEENVAFPLPKGLWESDLERAHLVGARVRAQPLADSFRVVSPTGPAPGRTSSINPIFQAVRTPASGQQNGTSQGIQDMSKSQHQSLTPATQWLREHKIPFEERSYEYVEHGGTALAASACGIDHHHVIKTLIMEDENAKPLVILMHGDREVSTKNLARQIGAKHVAPCKPEQAQRNSGYFVGGTSPFGTRKRMPVYVEASILELDKIFINGGRRGYQVGIDPKVLRDVLGAKPVSCALEKE